MPIHSQNTIQLSPDATEESAHAVSSPTEEPPNIDASNNDDVTQLPPARWKRLLRSWSFMVGMGLVTFWLVVSLLAPWLAPVDPLANFDQLLTPLSTMNNGVLALLGTDHLGRDVLSRILYGGRVVFFWATIATSTSYIIGISAGMISGYYGGVIDRTLSFLANIMLSFPVILVYLIIVLTLGGSGVNIVVAVAFTNAPLTFRLVRSLVLDIRSRDYVSAAVLRGDYTWYIQLVEILPNTSGPLLVDACLRFGYVAVTIGVLGFLGLGLPPPTPDWGGIVQEGLPYVSVFPHVAVFPCIAISSMVLGFNLIADALNETSR